MHAVPPHPAQLPPVEHRLVDTEGRRSGEPDASPAAGSLGAGLQGSLQSASASQLRARMGPKA